MARRARSGGYAHRDTDAGAWAAIKALQAVDAGYRASAVPADMAAIQSQTTLQNIPALALSISASPTEMWLLKLWIIFIAASVTMDIKFGFSVPAGCTMRWGTMGLSSEIPSWGARGNTNVVVALQDQTGVVQPGTLAGGSGVALTGIVYGGGTAGNVQAQYAQNTSEAANLQIIRGSALEATRLSA
jgi:hypothetical protein